MNVSRTCKCVCVCVIFSAILCTLPPGTIASQSDPKTQAQDALNQGIQAFEQRQFDEAIRDFTRATQLDPPLLSAHLYLAATYAREYIPGASSDENLRAGQQAAAEYKTALALDPENLDAMDGLGLLLFQMAGNPFEPKMMEEAKAQYLGHVRLRPGDAEPYYWVGVIDWTLAYRAAGEARTKYLQSSGVRLSNADPLPETVRVEYARENGAMIDEGIASLKKAIEIRADYDDAMAYLNLLYRLKAETVADAAQRAELQRMADTLIDQVREIKQKRASPSQ
jgi:tetratricopeptide (TPR) repeat protein